MLIGLNQNGSRSAQGLKPSLSWTNDRRRIERTSPTLANRRNTGIPYRSLWEDKPRGKSIAARVEDEGEREHRSVNGAINMRINESYFKELLLRTKPLKAVSMLNQYWCIHLDRGEPTLLGLSEPEHHVH